MGDRFLEMCDRCHACIHQCPENILVTDFSGFPRVDFQKGGCSFCGECVDHCAPKALDKSASTRPWSISINIENNCLTHQHVVCQVCREQCDQGAIALVHKVGSVAVPTIKMDKCTGCGFCLAVCPVSAISIGAPKESLIGLSNNDKESLCI